MKEKQNFKNSSSDSTRNKNTSSKNQEITSDNNTDNSQDSNKKKRTRITYTTEEVTLLRRYFEILPYPDPHIKHILSKDLCKTTKSVQVWFQNRRQHFITAYGQWWEYYALKYDGLFLLSVMAKKTDPEYRMPERQQFRRFNKQKRN